MIYDVLGRIVYIEDDVSGEFAKIDISSFSEGIYTLLFESSQFSCSKKLIVQ
jgi:hypothetical protein